MTDHGQPDSHDDRPDRAPLRRSAGLAWQASAVLLLLSALFTAVWLWELVRVEQHVGRSFTLGVGGFGGSASIVQRIDAGITTISFLFDAGLTFALGLGLRMAADVIASRRS